MGRGPKDIHAHLVGDLLVVRLQGILTAAEQHLVKSLPAEKGTGRGRVKLWIDTREVPLYLPCQ